MKLILALLLTAATFSFNWNDVFYQFSMNNIDGEEITLSEYKNKVILIVNVASKCGYTPQYEGLQKIYNKYKEEGLVILGFPANNFKGQEPGSDEEIKEFCTLEYGVEFPMFSKVSVAGEDQAELFAYLTAQPNSDFEGEIKWNFEKFLIDKEGVLQRRFRTKVKPESEELTSAIERELRK